MKGKKLDKDLGFGKCSCGQFAIVKLSGKAVCLNYFEASMKCVGDTVRKLREQVRR